MICDSSLSVWQKTLLLRPQHVIFRKLWGHACTHHGATVGPRTQHACIWVMWSWLRGCSFCTWASPCSAMFVCLLNVSKNFFTKEDNITSLRENPLLYVQGDFQWNSRTIFSYVLILIHPTPSANTRSKNKFQWLLLFTGHEQNALQRQMARQRWLPAASLSEIQIDGEQRNWKYWILMGIFVSFFTSFFFSHKDTGTSVSCGWCSGEDATIGANIPY